MMSNEKISDKVIDIIKSNNVKKMETLLKDPNFDSNFLIGNPTNKDLFSRVTPLILSSMWGKEDIVKVMADDIHTNLNAVSENGKTPLIYAIYEEEYDIALYLLKRKASPKIQTGSEKPLEMVLVKIFYDHESDEDNLLKLKKLAKKILMTKDVNILDDINNGENYYQMALRYSEKAKTNNIKNTLLDIVKMMEKDYKLAFWLKTKDQLKYNKVQNLSKFVSAIENKDIKLIKKILKNDHNFNLDNGHFIYTAAKTGDLNVLNTLTKHGFKSSNFIISSLFNSFVSGNHDVFNYLMHNHLYNDTDAYNSKLIKSIIKFNNPDLLKTILANPKTAKITEKQANELMEYAIKNDLSECVDILSAYGYKLPNKKEDLYDLDDILNDITKESEESTKELNDLLDNILDPKVDNKKYSDILKSYKPKR